MATIKSEIGSEDADEAALRRAPFLNRFLAPRTPSPTPKANGEVDVAKEAWIVSNLQVLIQESRDVDVFAEMKSLDLDPEFTEECFVEIYNRLEETYNNYPEHDIKTVEWKLASKHRWTVRVNFKSRIVPNGKRLRSRSSSSSSSGLISPEKMTKRQINQSFVAYVDLFTVPPKSEFNKQKPTGANSVNRKLKSMLPKVQESRGHNAAKKAFADGIAKDDALDHFLGIPQEIRGTLCSMEKGTPDSSPFNSPDSNASLAIGEGDGVGNMPRPRTPAWIRETKHIRATVTMLLKRHYVEIYGEDATAAARREDSGFWES